VSTEPQEPDRPASTAADGKVTDISSARRGKRKSATGPKDEPKNDADGSADDGEQGTTEEKKRGPSQSSLLVQLADHNFRVLKGDDENTYAVARYGSQIALPFRGRGGLRKKLAKLYYTTHGRTTPSATALADALTVIEAKAEERDPEPVALRVARDGQNNIVIDLGTADGSCVVVRPGCWEIVSSSPVLFRRTALVGAMPRPRSNGSLDGLRNLLNVDEDGWWLAVGWMIAALIPEIPHPVLAVMGLQGAAKTTALTMLVRMVDPSQAPTRSAPRDIKGWASAGKNSWVIALENISNIPAWFSDALCRAVTGDAIIDRQLYTDDDVSVVAFRRVIALNGIDAGELAGDLADRMVTLELARITPDKRRPETEVWADFQETYASAFGALLDLLAKVIEKLPDIKLAEMPRMADFARVLAAIDEIQGWNSTDAYRHAIADTQETVVDSDPFAIAVKDLVMHEGASGKWTGTPTELFDALMPMVDGKPKPPKGWPASLKAMTGRLKRVLPSLDVVGVGVEFSRESDRARTRKVSIVAKDPTDTEHGRGDPSEPSNPSEQAPDLREASDSSSDGSRTDRESVRNLSDDPSASRTVSDQRRNTASDGSDGSDRSAQRTSDPMPFALVPDIEYDPDDDVEEDF